MQIQEDTECNIKLVELVKIHPCIYNHALPDYSNRNKQDKIWGQIALQLNDTVAACRERWKNIRGRYVKQFNKLPSGSGAKSKKPYYLADYLNFLDTFIKSRPPTGNLHDSPENELGNSSHDEESLTSFGNIDQDFREAGTSSRNYTNTDTSAPSTPELSTRASSQNSQTSRLRNKKTSLDDLNQVVIDYFATKKKRLDPQPPNIDPDEAFLKSVLPDMKKMSAIQKRNFKVAVLQLAGQILNEPVTPTLPVTNVTPPSTFIPLGRNMQISQGQFLLPQFSPVTPVSQSQTACENNELFQNSSDFFQI